MQRAPMPGLATGPAIQAVVLSVYLPITAPTAVSHNAILYLTTMLILWSGSVSITAPVVNMQTIGLKLV